MKTWLAHLLLILVPTAAVSIVVIVAARDIMANACGAAC